MMIASFFEALSNYHTTNHICIPFQLPFELLCTRPSIFSPCKSSAISNLVDSCPFCDTSRYQVLFGKLESFFYLPTTQRTFDPMTGITALPPILIPFSFLKEDFEQISKSLLNIYSMSLHLYSLNCDDCSQIYHLECFRKYFASLNCKTQFTYPLIYVRDSDKRATRMLPFSTLPPRVQYPYAILSPFITRCFDCTHVENMAPFQCSRCWKPNRFLAKIQVRVFGKGKNAIRRFTEGICLNCMVCSHCFTSYNYDGNSHICSSLGIPKNFPEKEWGSFWYLYGDYIPFSFLFCGGCHDAWMNGQFCPICFQLYDMDNFSIPMINCDNCNRWVHIECDFKLNLSWYTSTSRSNDPSSYYCPRCTAKTLPTSDLCVDTIVSDPTPFIPDHKLDCLNFPFLTSLPSGTWILNRGIMPPSVSPYICTKWIDKIPGMMFPLDFEAARFVPSYRNPGKKTLLHVKVKRGWLLLNIDPEIQVSIFDDATFLLPDLNSWDNLWTSLWLKWNGYPPPFPKTRNLLSLMGSAYRKTLQTFLHPNSGCSRLLGFISRKTTAGYGMNRYALEASCIDGFNLTDDVLHSRSNGSVSLALFKSPIQGLGIRALKNININVPLLPYYGIVIGPYIAELLEGFYDSLNLGCYFFKFSPSQIIDATLCGSFARFINHSCDPNCITKSICSLKSTFSYKNRKASDLSCTSTCKTSCPIVVIYSKRNICQGEELTYDYMLNLEGDHSKRIYCECKSLRCRGYMN